MSLKDEMKRTMGRPIPYDTFKFALEVFQQAASGRMAGSHIPKPDPDKPGLQLKNIPMNRGMLAVMHEVPQMDDEGRQALGLRLMHYGLAIKEARADARFSDHFRPADGAEPDVVVLVSGPFTKAYAEARFRFGDNYMGVDMDDLFRLAEQYRAEEDAEERGS